MATAGFKDVAAALTAGIVSCILACCDEKNKQVCSLTTVVLFHLVFFHNRFLRSWRCIAGQVNVERLILTLLVPGLKLASNIIITILSTSNQIPL